MSRLMKTFIAAASLLLVSAERLPSQAPPAKRDLLEQRALEFVPADTDFVAMLDLTQLRQPWFAGKPFPIDATLDEHLGKEGLRLGLYDPQNLGASIAPIDRLVIVGDFLLGSLRPRHAIAAHLSAAPSRRAVLENALGAFEEIEIEGKKCFRSTGGPLSAHFTDDHWIVLAPTESLAGMLRPSPARSGGTHSMLSRVPAGVAACVVVVRDDAWCKDVLAEVEGKPPSVDDDESFDTLTANVLRATEHFELAAITIEIKPIRIRAACRFASDQAAKQAFEHGNIFWKAVLTRSWSNIQQIAAADTSLSDEQRVAALKLSEKLMLPASRIPAAVRGTEIGIQIDDELQFNAVFALLQSALEGALEGERRG